MIRIDIRIGIRYVMLMLMMNSSGLAVVGGGGGDPVHQLEGVSVMRIQSQTATNHHHRLFCFIPLPISNQSINTGITINRSIIQVDVYNLHVKDGEVVVGVQVLRMISYRLMEPVFCLVDQRFSIASRSSLRRRRRRHRHLIGPCQQNGAQVVESTRIARPQSKDASSSSE